VIARAKRGIFCGAAGATRGELVLLEAEATGLASDSRRHAELANEALALLAPGSSAHARAAAELAVASAQLGDLEALERAAGSVQQAAAATLGVAHALAITRTALELHAVGRPEWAEPLARVVENCSPAYEEDGPILETIRAWLAASRALFSGRPEVYAGEGAAIVRALERHGQLRSAVLAEVQLAMAYAATGAHERAVEVATRSAERAERMNLGTYAERARAYLALPVARGAGP
jgi:hypothetical protein